MKNRGQPDEEPEHDDFEEEASQRPVSASSFAKVQRLAIAMQKAETTVDDAEATLKARKEELARIRDRELPDAVAETGTTGLDIPNVGRVEAKPNVYGSLPNAEERPEERADALAYLEGVAPGLVKRTLTAKMPRDLPETFDADQLRGVNDILRRVVPKGTEFAANDVTENDPELTVSEALEQILCLLVPDTVVDIKLDVHAQTLCGWGRARLEEGAMHPWKKIGLTPITRASIKTPRAPRRAAKDKF
jgi:hypothetical protein